LKERGCEAKTVGEAMVDERLNKIIGEGMVKVN
jgi:hypothetical protein